MSLPEPQTFRLKRRGTDVSQGLIFLVLAASCAIQAYHRRSLEAGSFLTAWGFFALLGLGFATLTAEAVFKGIFPRLVFGPEGFVPHDFLKGTRVGWEQVKGVDEIDLKDCKRVDFGPVLKDAAIGKPDRLSMPVLSLAPYLTRWNESPIKQWLVESKPGLVRK